MYRIWRRWLSLLTALALALVFCFAACPFAAFADDTGQKVYQDMIYYTITPMHEVTITGARAILTEANIPAELDGCPVTEIDLHCCIFLSDRMEKANRKEVPLRTPFHFFTYPKS